MKDTTLLLPPGSLRPWGHEPSMKATKHDFVGADSLPECGEILPSQYHGKPEDPHLDKDLALAYATLEQAITDFQMLPFDVSRYAPGVLEELVAWFAETGPSDWPYSFENICDRLDINADNIRKALTRWRATHTEKPKSPFFRQKSHSVVSKKRSLHVKKHTPSRNRPCLA